MVITYYNIEYYNKFVINITSVIIINLNYYSVYYRNNKYIKFGYTNPHYKKI